MRPESIRASISMLNLIKFDFMKRIDQRIEKLREKCPHEAKKRYPLSWKEGAVDECGDCGKRWGIVFNSEEGDSA